MVSDRGGLEVRKLALVDTYDSASPVEVVKAIDLALRQYFGEDNWLAIRDRLFPGLRR